MIGELSDNLASKGVDLKSDIITSIGGTKPLTMVERGHEGPTP